MTTTTDSDLSPLPESYLQRQFIMVADDQVVEEATRERKKQEENEEASTRLDDWGKFATLVVGIAFPPARIGALGIAAFEATKLAIEAWGKASQSGVESRLVSASQARELIFPPGHPQGRMLYIEHPGVSKRYYPAAQFHRLVFEHKFSEAVTLLMALGASRIEVHYVDGWSKEFLGEAGAAIPLGSAEVNVGSDRKRSQSLLFEADLAPHIVKPSLPSGLVWYPHEYTWQAIAKGRMEHGLENFQMSVSYKDDFGVNAELGAEITSKKLKLKLGGEWQDHQSTVWRIQGKFGEG